MPEPTQQRHRRDPPGAQGQHDAHQVGPVGLDEAPVDGGVVEQGVDVGVARGLGRTVEDQVVPVADAREKLEAEQVGQTEDRQRLYVDSARGSSGVSLGLSTGRPRSVSSFWMRSAVQW